MNKLINKAYARASFATGALLSPGLSLLAQESGSSTVDTSTATSAATSIKTGLVTIVQSVAPLVVEVLLAVVGVVVIYRVAKWLLRAFNSR